MNIEDRHDGQLPRPAMSPQNRNRFGASNDKRPLGIRLNHRLRIVAKEQKWIVQVAVGPGVHIRTVDREAGMRVASRNLELAIGVTASIGQGDECRIAAADGRHDEVPGRVALFVAHAKREVARNLSFQFHIPGGAARVLQLAVMRFT